MDWTLEDLLEIVALGAGDGVEVDQALEQLRDQEALRREWDEST